MNKLFALRCATAALACTLVIAHPLRAENAPSKSASTPPTGAISGRVQNASISRYLTNARIAVKGTNLVVFTDEFGAYQINRVPAQPLILEIFYTGLDIQQIAVQPIADQTVIQDVQLTSTTLYQPSKDPVQMAAFVVANSKETEGAALASNEQRFAANIKSVVATDTFGDVQEGNLGEFIKFLPGVAVNYGDAEALSVSLRGFSPNLTSISSDGAQTSNANYNGASRAPFLSQTSINNISRVEVSKVPTPATAADSLGGSINMISKSAFERTRAKFRYRFYLSGNSLRLKIKDPYTFDERSYKILPNFDFDYTLPVTPNFGVVVTGMTSNFYNEQRIHQSAWAAAATGTTASFSAPFLSTDAVVDAPRYTWRKALGLNADWRVTPHTVLSAGFDLSDFHSQTANVSRSALTGTNGVPTLTPATGGVPFSFGKDYTIGATGRGNVNLAGNSVNRYEKTTAGKLRYRFDNGDWRINALLLRSASATRFRGGSDGWIFSSLAATLDLPVRISFSTIGPVGTGDSPTAVRGYFNDGQLVDLNNLNNYRVTTATLSLRDITDKTTSADLSVRRRLGFLSFPAAIQIGGLERVQVRDNRIPASTFTYNGVRGNLSAAPYQYQLYVNQDSGFGARDLHFINVGRASRAFQADPTLFSQTPAQVVAAASSKITTSEAIRETVRASYVQTEMQLFRQRLKILTGVRFEQTQDEGEGPFFDPGAAFLRTTSGTFARNALGQRIRRPDAGAAGSLEELRLIRQERGNHARGSYQGYYPSLHLTFNITENFLARFAYAKTYGRPDFNEVIPNVVINERDLTDDQLSNPGVIPGTLTVRNANLRPWSANNFDTSLEYYSDQGGTFTVGAFRKEIRNFFANDVRLTTTADIEPLGLDSKYVGYEMTTRINAGNARIEGVEFSLRHSLAPLVSWGRPFTVFMNATKLRLQGDRQADFSGFIKDSRSWGITLVKNPLTLMAKWNWRGEQKSTAFVGLGPDAFSYTAPRTQLDLNLDYQFGKRLSFFVNARNVFDIRNVVQRYGSETPAYAKVFSSADYGVQLGAGIKGSF